MTEVTEMRFMGFHNMDQISFAILAAFQKKGTPTCTCMAIERLASFSDELTEERNIV